MRESTPAERVKELLNEVIDLFLESESIPDSPHALVTTGQERRAMRRHAERLRNGEAEVVSKNLYSKKQLIRIFEDTGSGKGYTHLQSKHYSQAKLHQNGCRQRSPGKRL